jgi:hypothetical protein
MPPLPLPTEMTEEENSFQVLPPQRIYSKLSLSSTHIATLLPIQIDGPSSSSPISVPNPTKAAVIIFFVEDTSFSLSLDAFDGEFRCCGDQNSSLKPKARHFLVKELNLVMSDFTPRKRKLYHRIQSKESAHCQLRKQYRSIKLNDLCGVDSDPFLQEISSSLNAEAVRLLAAIIRNSRH